MTLTSAESIAVVEELGIERVVLARELSVGEIRKIRQQTDVPLEVFVHGALCVAYSGQCLTSESLGGRSANRGECAQACRLPYELVADGKDVDLGQVKYLLSPQDLAAYDLIPELIDIGVSAVKIEGRLKKPEYVANITRHYREAIDAATAGHPVQFTRREVEEMELSFSRGFSPGWLRGNDHKRLVPGLSSAKRGVLLGQVAAIRGNRVAVDLASSLARGDGVVFEGDRAAGDEQGGRVFGVYRGQERLEQPADSGRVELAFDRQAIDLHRLWIGQQIWKTDDPQLTARLKKTFTSPDPQRRVPLDVLVQAAAGQPLRIVGQTETGATCDVRSAEPLQVARRHPVTEEMLREQLGRLGNTVYALRKVEARIADGPMVPLSVLGQLRHELVRQLDASSVALPPRRLAENSVLERLRAAPPRDERGGQPASPQLRVLSSHAA
jgi:putative protease